MIWALCISLDTVSVILFVYIQTLLQKAGPNSLCKLETMAGLLSSWWDAGSEGEKEDGARESKAESWSAGIIGRSTVISHSCILHADATMIVVFS